MKVNREEAIRELNEMYATLNDSDKWHNHKSNILRVLQRKPIMLDDIITQMNDSLFNEEGTIDVIIGYALREIDDLKKCTVSDYEWKAYTMNIIKQCQNFIKSFIEVKESKEENNE